MNLQSKYTQEQFDNILTEEKNSNFNKLLNELSKKADKINCDIEAKSRKIIWLFRGLYGIFIVLAIGHLSGII